MKILNTKLIQSEITVLGIMAMLSLYEEIWITIKLVNQKRLVTKDE